MVLWTSFPTLIVEETFHIFLKFLPNDSVPFLRIGIYKLTRRKCVTHRNGYYRLLLFKSKAKVFHLMTFEKDKQNIKIFAKY